MTTQPKEPIAIVHITYRNGSTLKFRFSTRVDALEFIADIDDAGRNYRVEWLDATEGTPCTKS
jgi:hypothetical protein